jgi:hypothetical protein
MRKATLLISASLLMISASLLIGNSAAFATGWNKILTDSTTETVYTADIAGKSGNVKACYQSTCTFDTYTWTQKQTGNTRGSVTEQTCTDTKQVDVSNCY